jgi:Carboxypeptidase regulatory-like domain
MRNSLLPLVLLAICIFAAPRFCLAQEPVPPQTSAPQTATPQTQGEQNDQLCKIAGTVVSANTGEPLKKARVVLSLLGEDPEEAGDPNKQAPTATTDASGHFSIEKIPAGKYDLSVSRADYLASHYGQNQPDKPGATLSLAPGQKMTDLLFRLHRMGVITGRIQDEDGEPVRDVSVQALVHATERGKPKIEPRGSGTTNDLGDYRIVDLPPGRYSILASAPNARFPGESSEQAGGHLPTYFSGTTDSARASTLDVKSGDEVSGIDIVLAPRGVARVYTIRGHVVNTFADNSDARVVVMLMPRGNRFMAMDGDQKQAMVDTKTGNFEIKDAMPGEYLAVAFSFGDGQRHMTTQNVDVVGSDVDSVSLILAKGIDIPGRITLEGKSAASADSPSILLAPAESESEFRFGGEPATAKPDGSFVLKDIGDGNYSIGVYSKCRECYLKSAKANGVDLLEQGIQVASGAGPASIALVYSSNTGTVTGAVTNKDDLPAPAATVVLVPNAGSHQKPEQYKTSNTDQYGHFEIRGVPPGHYKAFAWEKIDAESYGDTDFLKPIENLGESLDVAANEQKSVQLKMIPAADSAN